MATVPIPPPPESQPVESLEQRFRRLEAIWERDTQFLSDAQRIIEHPAFQEIIALGEPVIPLMLHDLEQGPRQWVWALPRITGVNPVPPADGGNSRKMTESWLRWGREKGYRWWSTSWHSSGA
jgi:hypothetical protein